MSGHKNFLQRALDAIIEGRSREAERYVQRHLRDHQPNMKGGLTKR